MRFTFLTLFPEFFDTPLRAGLMGKAAEAGLVDFGFVDLRGYGEGKHKTTDDYPFGGGAGMVMKAEPVVRAIEDLRKADEKARVILLTPQGAPFGQADAKRLSALESVAFVCGRYEGFDERIRPFADEELSLGDFVLMGGEAAALAMTDAIARLVPGVLGDLASTEEESMSGGLLEYPQYTRPRIFRGEEVPQVLLSGNHAEIAKWRRMQSIARTARKRPDLLEKAGVSEDEARLAKEFIGGKR